MRSLAFVFLLTAACSGESKQASPGDSAGSAVDRTTLRIGDQKNGVLVIARERGVLEREPAPLALTVSWVEFTAGPPMLEAMSAGSFDFGQVGDTPPIFAQAAGGHIVYVASRSSFAIGTLTDDIIENQQAVADRLFRLGLIPQPVVVRDAVWFPPQS
jgi:NitT/TauT family transport system substrate-binding protein/sulfonate transport system substrate-binding protein